MLFSKYRYVLLYNSILITEVYKMNSKFNDGSGKHENIMKSYSDP